MGTKRAKCRSVDSRAAGALLTTLLVVTPSSPRAQPVSPSPTVNNWAEFREALAACWSVPAGTEGSSIAFRFGLSKTGAMRGPPLVTARQLQGDREARERYEAAASDALVRCFPMRVTSSFGAIFGESPIRLRFVNTPPTAAYQINSNITIFAPP